MYTGHTKDIGMLHVGCGLRIPGLMYLRTTFHIISCNGPLLITVRLKAKWKFCMTPMLLTFHKKLPKTCIFFKVYYHTSFEDPILIGTNIAPTSQVCVHHVGITDWRKVKCTRLCWPLMAWCSYHILWKSASWFKNSNGMKQTDTMLIS
jgi:hypothetical protein